MATKGKQNTSAKKAALTKSAFELTLRDFRIMKLTCERFLRPDQAPKGSFSVEGQTDTVAIPTANEKSSTSSPITITYRLQVIGTKESEEKEQHSEEEKSFSIDLVVEGFFDLLGARSLTEEDLSNTACMSSAIQQLHILCIDRVRTLAAELGYRAVRPEYGSAFEFEGRVERVS